MNKTTTPADAEAWAAAQPIRHRTAKRPYIPLGCDQQGRVTPTLLDDAQLAPAEELQRDDFKRPPTEQDIGEAIGTVVGFVLLILVFIGGLSWLLSPQGRAFFTWAGKTLAAIF